MAEETLAEQLARFNAERERLMAGRPITPEKPVPMPATMRGGDVTPVGWDDT